MGGSRPRSGSEHSLTRSVFPKHNFEWTYSTAFAPALTRARRQDAAKAAPWLPSGRPPGGSSVKHHWGAIHSRAATRRPPRLAIATTARPSISASIEPKLGLVAPRTRRLPAVARHGAQRCPQPASTHERCTPPPMSTRQAVRRLRVRAGHACVGPATAAARAPTPRRRRPDRPGPRAAAPAGRRSAPAQLMTGRPLTALAPTRGSPRGLPN